MPIEKKSASPLKPVEKAHEEEYFRKQNAELAAKLKSRLQMSQAGVKDDGLASELTQAGFNKDSVRALFIVPLIDVAWADNHIQPEERAEILKIVEAKGIEKTSEAYSLISGWLEKKPSDEKYVRAQILLKPAIEDLKKSGQGADWILDAATKVAEATGGLFGIGFRISKEERDVLRKISDRLN